MNGIDILTSAIRCSNEIMTIAAMLTVPNCFMRPREAMKQADEAKAKFVHVDGGHVASVLHSRREND